MTRRFGPPWRSTPLSETLSLPVPTLPQAASGAMNHLARSRPGGQSRLARPHRCARSTSCSQLRILGQHVARCMFHPSIHPSTPTPTHPPIHSTTSYYQIAPPPLTRQVTLPDPARPRRRQHAQRPRSLRHQGGHVGEPDRRGPRLPSVPAGRARLRGPRGGALRLRRPGRFRRAHCGKLNRRVA